MSEPSEARQRALAREAERQRLRDERKQEAERKRRARSGSREGDDAVDPHDAMTASGWDRAGWRKQQREKAAAAADPTGGWGPAHQTQEEQVIAHAAKLQNENQATLKNTIRVARETTVVGAATIHKLSEQTEQFERMDQTLSETQDSLSRSERILRGMKSIGGSIGQPTQRQANRWQNCQRTSVPYRSLSAVIYAAVGCHCSLLCCVSANAFSSGKSKSRTSSSASSSSSSSGALAGQSELNGLEQRDRARAAQRALEADKARQMDFGSKSPEAYPSQLDDGGRPVVPPNARQSAALTTIEANQKAEDDALDELSDVLGTLKQQSQVMSQQLNTQARILDGLEDKVDSTSARLGKGTNTMKKIT